MCQLGICRIRTAKLIQGAGFVVGFWDRDITYYCPNFEGYDLGYQIRNRKYRLHCNTCGNVFLESQSKGYTVSGSF